jgi:hypothetical protein
MSKKLARVATILAIALIVIGALTLSVASAIHDSLGAMSIGKVKMDSAGNDQQLNLIGGGCCAVGTIMLLAVFAKTKSAPKQ